jgi:Fe-S-cluster containining protein
MSDSVADDEKSYPLHDHHLQYIADLRVSEQIFATRFVRSCSTSGCSARCCREGVLVDIAHRDRVLAEASLIIQHMEPQQEHDPSRWFEPHDEPDLDYPSGRAVNTNIVNGTCVFLDSRRLCVLHSAEAASPGLKPFYCRAYPVAIDHGCVTLDVDWCPEDTQCCQPVDSGEQSALDVYEPELAHLLGDSGVRELRRVAEIRRQQPPLPGLPAPTPYARDRREG